MSDVHPTGLEAGKFSMRDVLAMLFVLSVGLGLRLIQLDLVDLRYDEASTLHFARGIAEGNWLRIAPFSGSVLNHPVAYLYVMSPPYLFTRDVQAALIWRVLLDVVAIGLTWGLCRRHFGAGVAFVAALLFAVAPWAVQVARKTGITVLPLGTALALWGTLELVQRRNAWGWALLGWGLTLTLGAHWTGLYLLPLTVGVMLWRWRTARLAPMAVGFLPLIAVFGAYLTHDAEHGFVNLRALLAPSSSEARWSFDAFRTALWLSGGAHLSDLTGPAFPLWQAQQPPVLPLLDDVQIGWLIFSGGAVGLVALVSRVRQRRMTSLPAPSPSGRGVWGEGAALLVLAWFAAPILLQLRHTQPIQMHYLLPTYPAGFILMALGGHVILSRWRGIQKVPGVENMRSRVAQPSPPTPPLPMGEGAGGEGTPARRVFTAGAPALRPLLLVGLLAVVGWQVFTTLRFNAFVEAHVTDPGGYGPPLRNALAVADHARRAIREGRAGEVLLAVPRDDPAVHEPATVLDVVLADVPRRFVNAENGLVLREDETQYIFAPGTDRTQAALAEHARIAEDIRLPVRRGSDRVYRYVRTKALQLPPIQSYPAQWAGGFGLLGYRLTDHAGELRLESYVRAFAQPPEPAIHWFSHLYAGDARIAQHDTGGIRPSQWRAGDVLLLWFDLALPVPAPPRPYVLRFGAYTYPRIMPVPLVDPAGAPVSDAVEITVR